MDNTHPRSFNIEIGDRILWFDGDVSVHPDRLIPLLLNGINIENLYVTEINDEIKKYNKLSQRQITIKTQLKPHEISWTINKSYLQIDIEKYIYELLEEETNNMSAQEKTKRVRRVDKELKLYKKHNLLDILKLMVYIIDVFEMKNIVWGVGRGSSVSSYVLYLIGIHDIDSVKYELPIEDFLHE